MKRCTKCGAQFDDSQNFCSQCGGELMAERVYEAPAPATYEAPASAAYVAPAGSLKEEDSMAPTLLTFISKALMALCTLLFGISILVRDYDSREASVVLFFLSAMGATACAAVGLILGMIKSKEKDQNKLFSGILNAAFATALFIVACVYIDKI